MRRLASTPRRAPPQTRGEAGPILPVAEEIDDRFPAEGRGAVAENVVRDPAYALDTLGVTLQGRYEQSQRGRPCTVTQDGASRQASGAGREQCRPSG